MPYNATTIRAEKERRAAVRKRRHPGILPPRLEAQGTARDLQEYLRGKSVVLVGPAAYLAGAGQGPSIDAHDVVVRINLDCPVGPALHERLYPGRPHPNPEDVGTRTDVLYHVLFSTDHIRTLGRQHTAEDVQAWREDGVRFLVTRQTQSNDRVQRIQPLLGDLPFVLLPSEVRAYLSTSCYANPNTGTIAIAHLLSMPVASLHVTGFDFYTGGAYRVGVGGFTAAEAARGTGAAHWGQSPQRRNVVHTQQPQMTYLKRLWEAEPRLSFDAVPARVLGVPASRPPCITALVPMKGQSERVPGKNLRLLAGKPLLYWTLKALLEAERVREVVVDTDSAEIARTVDRYFPDVTILDRPEHLRDGNTVSGNDLIAWELSQIEGEHFGQFHATSPLLTPETVDRAVEAYFARLDEHDSLFTVTEHHFWLFRADGTPVNSDTRRLVRSQDLDPLYEDNNAAHLFSRSSFEATGSRIGERVSMLEIPRIEATDIDYEDDFAIAEALMEARLRTTGKARRVA